jgi:hypothetical protein
VSWASPTPCLSRSLWQRTAQPSQPTVRTSWLSPRWPSTRRSVGRLYILALPIRKGLLTGGTVYKHNARAIASVVLLWPGWVCRLLASIVPLLMHRIQLSTVASTCILWASHFHDDLYGPKSAHVRRREEKTPISTPSRSRPSPTPAKRLSNLAAYKSGRWEYR